MNSVMHPSVVLYIKIQQNKASLWPFKTHIL